MTAHELARVLLKSPDVPVVINGWGSDESFTFEVSAVSPKGTCSFNAVGDTPRTPRDSMGYQKPRECVWLDQCEFAPSKKK